MNPRAAVITGFGINADYELAEAFELAGARARRVHVDDLIEQPSRIREYDILAFPGGFSFGDHLGSGLVFAAMVRKYLKDTVGEFVADGGLIIGICNGFQVLAKSGILPNLDGATTPSVSLVHNDSGVFEDSWVRLRYESDSHCVWTRGLTEIELPIRHGEGRFIAADDELLRTLEIGGFVTLRYAERNPNGSVNGIAGITDTSGRILGLMPHPEAFIRPEQHPRWTRSTPTHGEGLDLFRNGVEFLRSR